MRLPMFIAAVACLLLSACGPQAPATPNAVDVQASAMAVAATMIAQTQAAIPPTPVPTDTPVPSPTPLPSPTIQFLPTGASPSPTAAGGADNCLHPLDMGAAGPTHKVLIKNQTGGTINLSLNLNPINLFGQCGAMSFSNLGKNDTVMAGLPSGNWFAYAWSNTGKESFTSSGSFYVQPSFYEKMELCVREARVIFLPGC